MNYKYLFLISSLLLLVRGLHLHEASESYITYLQEQQQGMNSKIEKVGTII